MSQRAESLILESAETQETEIAPADYRPQFATDGRLVYDDELEPGPWRRFFNGGSSGLSFIRADAEGEIYFVHAMLGHYEFQTPNTEGWYLNAYDAFYAAEQQMPPQ